MLQTQSTQTVLEVTVRNHPGVMSHICGLFSRRAYNLEAILCMPLPNTPHSRIWLLVNEDHRLPQMLKQIQKLEDVVKLDRHGAGHDVFVRLETLFKS